jgi:hypothetical protein
MMTKISLLCLVSLTVPAWCQFPPHNPGDTTALFERASASSYVVVATVVDSKLINNKLTAEEAEAHRRELQASEGKELGVFRIPYEMPKSAFRYSLDVSQTLCRQSDFHPALHGLPAPDAPTYVVVPWSEMGRDADVEDFGKGQSYLVFLEKDPQQGKFGELYEIDLARTYYRAHLRSRGVVELPPGDPAKSSAPGARLLTAVTQLCDAVRPTDLEAKLANLARLRDSTQDLGLKTSAEAAITALRAEAARAHEP